VVEKKDRKATPDERRKMKWQKKTLHSGKGNKGAEAANLKNLEEGWSTIPL